MLVNEIKLDMLEKTDIIIFILKIIKISFKLIEAQKIIRSLA